MSVIDPFLAYVPIPHPLRTQENQRCNFWCPQVDIMGKLAINGLDKFISKCASAYAYSKHILNSYAYTCL